MPSPYHPCIYPGCKTLISPKATHCKRHVPHTPEWTEKIASQRRGKKMPPEFGARVSAAKRNRIERTCEHCGNVFHAKPSSVKNGDAKFCSSKCAYAARSGSNSPFWKGGKPTFECPQCHVSFDRHACFARGELTFCSETCRSVYYKARQATSNTLIERLMRGALRVAGFLFQEQIALCNTTVADFYDPEHQIAVFCDGDYWHGLPEHVSRDSRQTATLEAAGIQVLRFGESVIKRDIASCINHVALALRRPAVQLRLPTVE